jgi:MacB-like periplasmic core domain
LSLPGVRDTVTVRVKMVDPWYFGVMQIPVEAGRGIESRDRAGAPPIVVINQEVAGELSKTFGIANPVGRTVGLWVPGYGPIPESLVNLQIVGVIRSERTAGLQAPPELVVYVPFAQAPRQDINLVVRTRTLGRRRRLTSLDIQQGLSAAKTVAASSTGELI